MPDRRWNDSAIGREFLRGIDASFGSRGGCLRGAAISAHALLFWALTLEPTAHRDERQAPSIVVIS